MSSGVCQKIPEGTVSSFGQILGALVTTSCGKNCSTLPGSFWIGCLTASHPLTLVP